MRRTVSVATVILAGALVTTGCQTGTPTDLAPEETARYRVTFTATWSAATHPDGFPANPHFSGLVGATHAAGFVMWRVGAQASPGIENMAETGGKNPLLDEVGAAVTAGTAFRSLSGDGIPVSPGTVSLEFEAHQNQSLLSVVSMIAPSPDWFVGVADLALFTGGDWVDELSGDLNPYDSGTDSGTTYTAANENTNPADPIARITTAPFDADDVLGTWRVSRIQ